MLVIAWIAWTIYVWSTNGSTAGLGVLISLAGRVRRLALVAAPFVLVARLDPPAPRR